MWVLNYLLTVEIARALRRDQKNKDGKGFVFHELSPRALLDEFGPSRPGKLSKDLRSGGRIDVTLFHHHHCPRAVVEVKRISGDVGGLAKHAARLAALMRLMGKHSGGPLRYAAPAAIRICEQKDITLAMQKIANGIQSDLKDFKCSFAAAHPDRV